MKPNISALSAASQRVQKLRRFYLENSPMVLNRDLVPWKCSHSARLYTQGYLENAAAPTLRLRRAEAERFMLEHTKPIIVPGELIVGQPDFSPFTEDEQAQEKSYQLLQGAIPAPRGRADHMALNYEKLLALGVEGLIHDIEKKRDALDPYDGSTAARYELYEGCLIELRGVLTLANHYAQQARCLAEKAAPSDKADYEALADVLDHVPAKPARSFREALQSVHFFLYNLYGIYSCGRPDQYLLPYYRRDIEKGLLSEESAQELIDCFCLQYMNNMSAWAAAGFMLGGRTPQGEPVENELTWHFLIAIGHTRTPDPNVGLCVTRQTSQALIDYAASLIQDGCGNPQIWNNDAVTASMLKNGYTPEHANYFTHSTCVEITPIGCSGVSITSPYINMLKIFTDMFMDCPDDIEFEELFNRYADAFDAYCRTAMLQENLWQLERGRNGTDPLRISPLIDDCMARGLSSDAGGAKYNMIEPNMLGMINVVECFNVLHELVYRDRQLTIAEFKAALADNYAHHDALHARIIHKVDHFGNGGAESSRLARRISDMVLDTFARHTTARGAKVVPGAFSYRDHEINGRYTMASPDGRLSGQTLADGSSPVQGYNRQGPTMTLLSTAAWESARFLGGTAINLKISKSAGTDVIRALILGFLETNSAELQFNVVSTETLLDAQKHPEQYGDLLVRIGGYSDYFTRIPEALQNDVISRSIEE